MKKTVLIVDDNHLCVEGIQKSVPWELLGIENIITAYDGQSALDCVHRQKIDLVISDISMPGLSGLELSENIISIDSSVKIILISAYDTFEYARRAVRLGAFDYIEKPIDYEYLIEILKRALKEIEQEAQNLSILQKSRSAMKNQFFRSLLQIDSAEHPETLQLYINYLGLNLSCNYYTALYLIIEESNTLKQKLGIEEYHVRIMSLENHIKNICAQYNICYIIRDLSGFVCIIGECELSRNAFKNNIMLTFTDIVEHFQDRFELVIGLGTIVNSIWDLASSYIQAKKSLEYRFFSPAQNILEPRSFMENNSSLLFSRKNNAEDLIQLICKNDLSGIHDWINDFANSFSYNCDSKNLVYTLLYSVLARILSFCCDMNITTEHFEQEITSVFSSPEKFNTIDHVASWLYALCENICNCLQESVASYHQSLCESAASYIQTNYTNCNLSLLEIAEHVQITPSYLSTLFKKLRGQNISNYITDIRNEAACQLLKNTSLPLKIISSQVGYSNQYYFSSCFKKKMGMTPSAYRESA